MEVERVLRLAVVQTIILGCAMIGIPVITQAQSGRPPPPPSLYVIHGIRRTCDSIDGFDRALSAEDPRYFAGWTPADYDTAAAWASACVVNGYQYFGPARVAHLREYERKVFQPPPLPPTPQQIADAAATRQRIADEQEADRRATEKANARANELTRAREMEEKKKEAQRQTRINATAQCRLTDDYHIFIAQGRLTADIDKRDRLNEVLEHERKIENVSGVQNLSLDYELGAQSVHIDELIEKDWDKYQEAGGLSRAGTGLQLIDNPCATVTE